jgi:hypothetical protein
MDRATGFFQNNYSKQQFEHDGKIIQPKLRTTVHLTQDGIQTFKLDFTFTVI